MCIGPIPSSICNLTALNAATLNLYGNGFNCYPACISSIADMSRLANINLCIDPLCYIAAAMEIATIYSEWSCTDFGHPVGDYTQWRGLTISGGAITAIDFSGTDVAGNHFILIMVY